MDDDWNLAILYKFKYKLDSKKNNWNKNKNKIKELLENSNLKKLRVEGKEYLIINKLKKN